MNGLQSRTHVLIVVENLPVPFDRRVWNEARALRDAGYLVSVISPTGRGAEALFETIDGIDVYRHVLPVDASSGREYIAEYWAAFTSELRLARAANRKQRVDIVHICNPPDFLFLVGLYLKLLVGARLIFDHHDLTPELFEVKFGRRGPLYWVTRLLERMTFLFADISIATNDSYREIAIRRGRKRPDKVFTVRSGPDLNRMKIGQGDARWRKTRRYLVGYVGVMGKQEGIDLLLAAVRHIVKTLGRDDIQFCLVGGGPELAALVKLSESLGVEDFVTFTGRVPDDVMLDVLNCADICVNPDAVNPMNDLSTMNKIVEYMALEKPIVQFELKEGRVSAQDASLYAKPNDVLDLAAKMLELLADPDRRALMGAIGLKRVHEHLSWEHERPRLLAAYASLGLPARRP